MAAFIPPRISLDPNTQSDIQTLPALVDFHAENNPQHLFCIQVKRDNGGVRVSYAMLRQAIVGCQAWLRDQAIGLQPPVVDPNGNVKKSAPIAILMESHVFLAIYVLAGMGMGIPIVLLSVRLSASAVRHLIRQTGAKLILVSPRLRPLASEAFPAAGEDGDEEAEHKDIKVSIRLVAEYESFLEKGAAAGTGRITTYTAHPNHFVSEEDRQVLILHSSGTSGLPKPIPCSHRYLLGYATCHSFRSNEEAHGLTISTLPIFHVSNTRGDGATDFKLIVATGLWTLINLYIPGHWQDSLYPPNLNDSKRGIHRNTHRTFWSESIVDSAVDTGRNRVFTRQQRV